ncbi:MAG: NAD(P)-dependent oxidoreductase, partial [Glaciecola sp.]
QRTQTWQAAPYSSLAKKTLGILGMGNIGSGIADIAQQFNMNVVALSRRAKPASANQRHIMHFAPDQLLDMVKQCDFIVNLLPETPRTIGLCDADFFAAIKPGSVFINVGRGSVIGDYTDLQNALNTGGLRAAVLDVFEQEPLANNHPLYSQTGMYITNHTAAESLPIKVFEVFTNNAMRYAKGESLLYVHNFKTGY